MKIFGIGETVYDIIFRNNQPDKAVPGGSTFNAMISLGRTLGKNGVPCLMISETGDDHIGNVIKDFMERNNVSSQFVTVNKGTKTHISLAFLDDNNDAQYEFYKDHEHANIKDNLPTVTKCDIVLFGSFFTVNPVIRETTREFLQKAYEAGATMYYDINFRKNHRSQLNEIKENILENYKFATIVRGSREDFQYLYDCDDAREIYQKYINPYCRNFIYTDAAGPVKVFTPSLPCVEIETEKIETVSTIGAGDNFNAGIVYALAKDGKVPQAEQEWRQAVAISQKFAANVCKSIYNYVDPDMLAIPAIPEIPETPDSPENK